MKNGTLIHEETTPDGFHIEVCTVPDGDMTPYHLIEYEEENRKRIEDWKRGRWWYIGVVAEVHACDIELGGASIWGVESDCGHEYLQELARDTTNEALGYARYNVRAIIRRFGAVAAE